MRISFTGDILVNLEQYRVIAESERLYKSIFENVATLFVNTDYLVGNLETPLGLSNFTDNKWKFCTPGILSKVLADFGFDLLTLANNHILDRGIEGLKTTISILENQGIEYIGVNKTPEREHAYKITNIGEYKIAFLNYTYGTNAHFNGNILTKDEEYVVNLLCPQEGQNKIKKGILSRALKKGLRILGSPWGEERYDYDSKYACQILNDIKNVKEKGATHIIACIHSGGQYNDGPERWTRTLMKWLVDNGVDVVVGTHPHVIHPTIKYKGGYIAYSLGDFTSTPFCEGTPMELARKNKAGIGQIVHIDLDSRGNINMQEVLIQSIIGSDNVSRIHCVPSSATNPTMV